MKDIEETVNDSRLNDFVIDFSSNEIKSQEQYRSIHDSLKKKYKLCPNKPTLLKTYNTLIKQNEISKNQSFIDFCIKKKGRSSSGVSVITILTSPTPEYTDNSGTKVKQSFSCGHNCSYCPNEPEIHINLSVVSVDTDGGIIINTGDDIGLIRLLTYVIKDDVKYIVNNCNSFTENSFYIDFKVDNNGVFKEGDKIIGVKGEQPRSYLSTEPAVLRANRNGFDAVLQVFDRADALLNCGHEVDKIEVLVLGGTWDNYPLNYQTEFIRDIYYSINNLTRRNDKPRLSLEEEIRFAQYSEKRIIGLTLETRPDYINLRQIRKMRRFNVTRLQIGVQHIDDDVLNYIERGCTTADTIKGNYLWKHNGGKIDWHIMPDLPGSSIEKDMDMFKKIFGVNNISEIKKNYFKYDLQYPELQADQFKIYPCSVVDWTKIKELYDNGTYKPYSEDQEKLIGVIAYLKNNIFPWVRLNRIIRDIPNINIKGGNENVNLRQILLKRKDIHCKCIRCREVKNRTENIDKAELFIREYNALNGTEYFISFESPDQEILYGFLRLRINHIDKDLIYKELEGSSFIRELHVYGKIVKHNVKSEKSIQHMGFGKRLIQEAEKISMENGIYSVAIIAGVGVREYYGNIGYELVKDYMVKKLTITKEYPLIELIDIFIIGIILSISANIIYNINF